MRPPVTVRQLSALLRAATPRCSAAPLALPSRRGCDENAAPRYSVDCSRTSTCHAVVGHCLLLVDKRRIRVAPPSLQTHFRPTRLPSQPELTRPIFSARAKICSSLSHSDELLIVLLVSTACYLAWFIFLNLSKNLALTVFVSFIIYRVQFTFMYVLFVWFVPRNSRREFANDDEKKPGVRCRELGSSYRKQKPGVRTANTRTSTVSRKSKCVQRVELPVYWAKASPIFSLLIMLIPIFKHNS